MTTGAAATPAAPTPEALATPESPWRRAWRRMRRKRIAVAALLVVAVIYGAGLYTLLDLAGVPTGLQDPVATNTGLRREVREVEGQGEPLGVYLDRLAASLDFERLRFDRDALTLETLIRLNPDVVAEFGPLTAQTVLPPRTNLILTGEEALEGPSWDHLFGTDRLGRDLFSRTLFSARTTVIITLLSFLFGNVVLGLGLLAGYARGWVDAVIMRVGDVILALPGLLILIVVNASLRDRWSDWLRSIDDFLGIDFLIQQGVDDFSLLFFALSFFGWVETARFVRAQVLALREEEFVVAAESIGATTPRILAWHLFPGVLPWIIVGMSASLGAVAGAEVALTWLGLGIQPPTASFGAMITDAGGARTFDLHPHLLLVPGVTIALLIFAFNLLGDAINDVVSPRGT